MSRRTLSLCVLLAGCRTVGPDYQQPAMAVPDRYAETDATIGLNDAELGRWWERFGDPHLDALVRQALAQNLDIAAASARIREARAIERAAGASAAPEVSAQASAARQRISENAIPAPPGSGGPGSGSGGFGLPGQEFDTFRVGFDAAWELDLFGRTRRAVEAASARTGAAVWSRRDAEVSIAAEIVRTYWSLATIDHRLANAEAEFQRQLRLERLLGAQAAGGLITNEELRRQQSERIAAAAALPPLRAEAKAELHALGVLVGAGPEAYAQGLGRPLAVPPDLVIPAGLPSELLRRRPDIRRAERELAAATADIGVAVADLYPRISLTAAPALVSTALGSLLEWGSRAFSVGAALDWPLFDGGRRRATVEARNARQEQAMIAYRKAVLTALQEVEDALSRIDGDRARLRELEQAVSASTNAERIALTRFRGGLVTEVDVLAERARRLAMEEQVIQTRGALARDTVALVKALGGGWPGMGAAS
jgi:NodT family efflux transporter outer membrane factor (OMF) lipoprotein